MRKRDREFIREVLREQRLISDRRFSDLLREMRTDREKDRAEMREHFAEQREKLNQIIADGEAQRAALFAILDRMSNGGTAAAG